MAEARVLYGSQGDSLLHGGGSWRQGIPSLLGHGTREKYFFYGKSHEFLHLENKHVHSTHHKKSSLISSRLE